jgi:hypothetical protein
VDSHRLRELTPRFPSAGVTRKPQFPMCTVEKGTISEYLCVSKAEAQEEQRHIKGRSANPGVPPIRQMWTHGQREGLECEKDNEESDVAAEQSRELGLDCRTGEHVRRNVFSASGSGTGECEEEREDRVDDRRRRLEC